MAYSLKKIHDNFYNEVININTIIDDLVESDDSLERDLLIEGCFIRFVVNWEIFIEEFYLRCCCGAKSRSGKMIKPKSTKYKNIEIAFRQTHKERKTRNSDFLDWLSVKPINLRLKDHFRSNSRVFKIVESPDKIFAVRIIRNAIAHRSISAIKKFNEYVTEEFGYLPVNDPSMPTLLLQRHRRTNKIIFKYLSEYYLDLSNKLAK